MEVEVSCTDEEREGSKISLRTETILLVLAGVWLLIVGGFFSFFIALPCLIYGIYLLIEDTIEIRKEHKINIHKVTIYKKD